MFYNNSNRNNGGSRYNQVPLANQIRTNRDIKTPTVRLLSPEGEFLGIVSIAQALDKARSYDLDLIEISPNASPPVCKIFDYGKHKYEEQRKANEAKKKQKTVETKEIKYRPNIASGDYDTKLRNIKRFIEDEDKVKVLMQFRGRELAHKDVGLEVVKRIVIDLEGVARPESGIKMEDRSIYAIFVKIPAQPV